MDESGFSGDHLKYWCQVGGLDTIASYDARFANIPESHWEFIRNTLPYYETGKVIYVHGGAAPKKPLVKQDPVNLAWRRFSDAKEHSSGKLVVCGHTIQRKGKPMIKDTPYVLIQRLVEEVGSLVLTLKRAVIGRPTSKGNCVNGGSKRGRKREQ